MNTPRCGNSDQPIKINRAKRYIIRDGVKWNKDLLTWDIVTYTEDLPENVVDWQAERAFQVSNVICSLVWYVYL